MTKTKRDEKNGYPKNQNASLSSLKMNERKSLTRNLVDTEGKKKKERTVEEYVILQRFLSTPLLGGVFFKRG